MSLYDLVRCNVLTVGYGTMMLGSAVTPFITPAQASVPDGAILSYGLMTYAPDFSPTGSEAGTGTYSTAANSITRNPITSNHSNTAIYLTGISEVVITALGNNCSWGWEPQPVTGTTFTVPDSAYGDVLVNRNGTVSIQLGLAANRLRVPVSTVDFGGNASDTNVITISPHAGETIMGLSSWTITNPYGSATLWPYAGTGWYQK